MPRVILLGPQRLKPTVGHTLKSLRLRGPVAAVTAGWEERESEDEELLGYLPPGSFNLQLWERCDRVFTRDPELLDVFLWRRDRQRQLQALYRRQLRHAMAAAREFLGMTDEDGLIDPERTSAIERVREIDAQHIERVREIENDFIDRIRPDERPSLAAHRHDIAPMLAATAALVITGGHVRVLLNRLRLFDILGLLGDKPIVAWSAGAMVLCERIILFHDSPPQGPGNAEVMEEGLGLCPALLPFPHARHRLDLHDPVRVTLLARRFSGFTCVPMDEGTRLD